mmetsp:Transcript_54093/g.108818  ORF Transcript_54093/g.108818 Transcript_54093/m.108818 type:complete len:506 (-) Transcript_54093:198-1715(-)
MEEHNFFEGKLDPTPFPSFVNDVLGKKSAPGMDPTSAPSPYPYTQADRDVQMITSEVISLFNRSIIMTICVWRLAQYKRRGVLNYRDLKTRFHVAMLFTVPLYAPYFSFCLAHYNTWQCYFNSTTNSKTLYQTAWVLYSLYRIGLSVQLVCLSITVLQWSDFLSLSDRLGRLVYGHTDRHKNLVCYLLSINTLDIVGSCLINGFVIYDPSIAEGSNGTALNFWIYLNWLFLDTMQISLVMFLILQGRRIKLRIRDSSAFDGAHRSKLVVTLNTVLFLVASCLGTEVAARVVGSLPLFYQLAGKGDSFGSESGGTSWVLYHFVEENHLLWQFTCYILPYDCVSFCLLYLMRAPPRPKPPSFTSTVDADTGGLERGISDAYGVYDDDGYDSVGEEGGEGCEGDHDDDGGGGGGSYGGGSDGDQEGYSGYSGYSTQSLGSPLIENECSVYDSSRGGNGGENVASGGADSVRITGAPNTGSTCRYDSDDNNHSSSSCSRPAHLSTDAES